MRVRVRGKMAHLVWISSSVVRTANGMRVGATVRQVTLAYIVPNILPAPAPAPTCGGHVLR